MPKSLRCPTYLVRFPFKQSANYFPLMNIKAFEAIPVQPAITANYFLGSDSPTCFLAFIISWNIYQSKWRIILARISHYAQAGRHCADKEESRARHFIVCLAINEIDDSRPTAVCNNAVVYLFFLFKSKRHFVPALAACDNRRYAFDNSSGHMSSYEASARCVNSLPWRNIFWCLQYTADTTSNQ